MRTFQAVVDEGGFAAAAKALNMSAPVVTRLISDLELHLRTRLIQRTTRRMALTDAGETFLARVREILHDVDDAEAEACAHTRELSGVIRVCATPIIGSHLLAPLMASWHQRHPGTTIEIAVEPFPQNHIQAFDLSLLAVDEGYDANVVARPLLRSDYVVCASPAYLAERGHPQQPEELARHPYLRFPWQDDKGAARRGLRLREAGAAAQPRTVDVDMPVAMESLSHHVLHRAAMDGAGIAVLSRTLIAPELASGRLVHLLPDWLFGRFTVFAALPSRKIVPRKTRTLLEFLATSIPGGNGGAPAFAPRPGVPRPNRRKFRRPGLSPNFP